MSQSRVGWAVRLMPPALTSCLILMVCSLSLSRSFYELCAIHVFFALTLASVVIVFVHVRPVMEFLQLAAVVTALGAAQAIVLRVPLRWPVIAGLVGVSSLGLLGVRRVWATPEKRTLLHYAFLPPLLFVLLEYASPTLLGITGKLHPKTLDVFLYVFDGSLGVQPSFVVGQWALRSHWLIPAAVCCYYLLPAVLMFVYSQQLVRNVDFAMQAFLAFFIAGPLGVIFYNLVPACGPVYLVGANFPLAPASLQQLKDLLIVPVAISGARNAFPSLHMGWALLAWWYSAGTSWWTRSFAAVFAAGTAVATLAIGEHYLVDLVVAFPFVLIVGAACRFDVAISKWRRWGSILGGLSLLLGWAALLRFAPRVGLISPIVPWALIGGTLAFCWLLRSCSQGPLNSRPENQVDA